MSIPSESLLSPTQIADLLREHGLRVTSQRRAILGTFEGGNSGHLTADEVLERARQDLPEVCRATVYGTLSEFVKVGLLKTVEGQGATRYDPNLDDDHQHFRCLNCNQLYDVHVRQLEQLAPDQPEFITQSVKVIFEGTCPTCSKLHQQ